MIKKISEKQMQIIIAAAIIAVLLLSFYFFIYSPANNKVKEINKELSNAQNQIQSIENIIGSGSLLSGDIAALEEEDKRLLEKFPGKEEKSLKLLYEFARGLDIKITSLLPQPKAVIVDENGRQIQAGEKVFQRVGVSLTMQCSYNNLVKYITILKKQLPGFISIEMMRLNKDSTRVNKLNVDLMFNLFLLTGISQNE